jgi:hypothetical protein
VFREHLKELNLVDELFAKFHGQLAMHGYVARSSQMIDATFVEVPRQRNTRKRTLASRVEIHLKSGTRSITATKTM